jgi:uncharacterized protein YeaO (DUF488 family)
MPGELLLWRVYDGDARPRGRAFLVERLWPRGVRRDDLRLDGWLKDVAPSPELRRWYGHEPDRWEEFCRRYTAELDAWPEAWEPLLREQGPVVLAFSARDRERNSARVLRDYLLALRG